MRRKRWREGGNEGLVRAFASKNKSEKERARTRVREREREREYSIAAFAQQLLPAPYWHGPATLKPKACRQRP